MNPWKSESYQGAAKKKRYFEGWYFKQVSADFSEPWSFIPGIARGESRGEGYSFVQAIEGRTGRTWWYEYPLSAFEASGSSMDIRVGASRFSPKGISLELEGESSFKGELRFGEFRRLSAKILSPGVMGPFSFLPFMECRHGLVSLDHRVEGGFEVDGRSVDMSSGRGYIEKDWGSSMPGSWIWTQSNNFPERGDSFMLSVADIPWMGKAFTGFLCAASLGGRILREATYTGARLEGFSLEDGALSLALARGSSRIELRATRSRGGLLRAPVNGLLSRRIAESIDARIELRWTARGKTLFEAAAPYAGLELVGDPASLFESSGEPRRYAAPATAPDFSRIKLG
jgi:tocopherol cyclase